MNKIRKIIIGAVVIIPLLLIMFITVQNNPDMEGSRTEIEKEEKGPDQYPSDWAWLRRTFPYWKADAQYFRDQMKVAQQMRAEAPNRELVQAQFAGPTNIGGRFSDIEFNPKIPILSMPVRQPGVCSSPLIWGSPGFRYSTIRLI